MNRGALAQLGERFAGSEEVSGSSPLCSTNVYSPTYVTNGVVFRMIGESRRFFVRLFRNPKESWDELEKRVQILFFDHGTCYSMVRTA